MKTSRLLCALLVLVLGCAPLRAVAAPAAVAFPAGVVHDAWDALVRKYVDDRGLVAYGTWKDDAADRKALDNYLAQFARRPAPAASGDDLAASAINAYNAFAVRWILTNYPTESIMALPDSLSRKEHLVGGRKVSLEDIEHGTLRPAIGYRAHVALVCCARSCPPLRRIAYTAAEFSAQIDDSYTIWLAREDLNTYEPARNRVAISSIFKWFKADFEKAGGTAQLLGTYGPASVRPFLSTSGYRIDYLPYQWGLNDQGGRGANYSRTNRFFDSIFK